MPLVAHGQTFHVILTPVQSLPQPYPSLSGYPAVPLSHSHHAHEDAVLDAPPACAPTNVDGMVCASGRLPTTDTGANPCPARRLWDADAWARGRCLCGPQRNTPGSVRDQMPPVPALCNYLPNPRRRATADNGGRSWIGRRGGARTQPKRRGPSRSFTPASAPALLNGNGLVPLPGRDCRSSQIRKSPGIQKRANSGKFWKDLERSGNEPVQKRGMSG